MLKGRIKYSTKVWYPDPRCFNDLAVDVKGSVLYIEKLDLNREEKYLLFLESIPIQNSYRSKPCIRGQW